MLIADIVPYGRNARNNERAIPKVAESIKEFGLRGTIGLESRENPVIVFGHTRVAACKSLGWTEIPDERIEYCDDLTPEQIKAFRIADNKTGDIATYNKAMLREEVRSLKDMDMSRFGLEFKSKGLPYGAEMTRNNNGWNLDKCSKADCKGRLELPTMDPVDVRPTDMMSFNFAKSAKEFDKGIHFCIDDYQFERVWNRPEKYVELLRKFECVVTPDFSVYTDMPYPMKLWNVYRSLALGRYWQSQGLTVVPNATWSDEASLSWIFKGLPKGGTVFVSTLGVTKVKEYAEECAKGSPELERQVKPSRILLLGDTLGYEFGCEVVRFKVRKWNG